LQLDTYMIPLPTFYLCNSFFVVVISILFHFICIYISCYFMFLTMMYLGLLKFIVVYFYPKVKKYAYYAIESPSVTAGFQ